MKRLIISYNFYHLSLLLPIITKLERGAGGFVIICFDVGSQRRLYQEKMPYKAAFDYLPERLCDKIHQDSISMVKRWADFKIDGKPFREYVSYNGIEVWDLIEDNIFKFLFEPLYTIAVLDEIFKSEIPDEVIAVREDGNAIGRTIFEMVLQRKIALHEINLQRKDEFKIISGLTLSHLFFEKNIKFFLSNLLYSCKVFNEAHRKVTSLRYALSGYFLIARQRFCKIKITGRALIFFLKAGRGGPAVLQFPELPSTLKANGFEVLELTMRTVIKVKRALQFGFLPSPLKMKKAEIKSYIDQAAGALSILFLSQALRYLSSYRGVYLGRELFKQIFDIIKELPHSINTAEFLVESFHPHCVVSSLDTRPYIILGRVAKKYNIPSLRLPHFEDMNYLYPGIPKHYDIYCLGSERLKNKFIRRNIDGCSLYVVGFPPWSIFEEVKKKKKNFTRSDQDKNNNLFILTTSKRHLPDYELAKIAVGIMKNYPDKQLLIRPHPVEGSFNYRFLKNIARNRNILVSKKGNIQDVLPKVDLVLTCQSTTALEAMLKDKPVLSLNLDSEPYQKEYIINGAHIIYKATEIMPAIDRLTKDRYFKEALKEKSSSYLQQYNDGFTIPDTLERITKLIENLILQTKKERGC